MAMLCLVLTHTQGVNQVLQYCSVCYSSRFTCLICTILRFPTSISKHIAGFWTSYLFIYFLYCCNHSVEVQWLWFSVILANNFSVTHFCNSCSLDFIIPYTLCFNSCRVLQQFMLALLSPIFSTCHWNLFPEHEQYIYIGMRGIFDLFHTEHP